MVKPIGFRSLLCPIDQYRIFAHGPHEDPKCLFPCAPPKMKSLGTPIHLPLMINKLWTAAGIRLLEINKAVICDNKNCISNTIVSFKEPLNLLNIFVVFNLYICNRAHVKYSGNTSWNRMLWIWNILRADLYFTWNPTLASLSSQIQISWQAHSWNTNKLKVFQEKKQSKRL